MKYIIRVILTIIGCFILYVAGSLKNVWFSIGLAMVGYVMVIIARDFKTSERNKLVLEV